jgi:hypothetical protein
MKKTKYIELVLISAALASCHKPRQQRDWGDNAPAYIRSDSTAPYSRVHRPAGSPLLWYYAFRPYGNYYNGSYRHAGYYSGAISERSNIGSNGFKSSVSRGGFGRGAFSVSS